MKRILFIFLISILAACSSSGKEEELHFLEVDLSVTPEHGEVNEPIVFEAKVTYGDEEVTDADEVIFEIWRAHDENHEKIEVSHSENGIYRLEKTFDREGTYYIISHVTARDFHNMPRKEFVIGEPSESEDNPKSSHMDHEDEEHNH